MLDKIQILDDNISKAMLELHNDKLTDFCLKITKTSNTKQILVSMLVIATLVFIIYMYKSKKRTAKIYTTNNTEKYDTRRLALYNALFALFMPLVIAATNQVLKRIIKRPRPEIFESLVEKHGYSFPSGHAMGSAAVCAVLSYYISKSKLNPFLKATLITILVIFNILVCFSRVYIGVHYFTDVAVGLVLAWIMAILMIRTFDRFRIRRGLIEDE